MNNIIDKMFDGSKVAQLIKGVQPYLFVSDKIHFLLKYEENVVKPQGENNESICTKAF